MWSAEQMQPFFDMLCLVFNLLLTTDSIVVLLKKGMESCVCSASAAYMLGQSGLSCLAKAVYDLPVRFCVAAGLYMQSDRVCGNPRLSQPFVASIRAIRIDRWRWKPCRQRSKTLTSHKVES